MSSSTELRVQCELGAWLEDDERLKDLEEDCHGGKIPDVLRRN
jgi:hypothetical protein